MVTLRVGNAPCSWGVMGGYDASLFPPYEQVLDEIAAAGYNGTELGDWGYLPTDADKLRDELTSRGLSMIGALVPVALTDRAAHDAGREDALRTARLLAAVAAEDAPAPFIILSDKIGADPERVRYAGRIRAEQGLSEEQWEAFAAGTVAIVKAVADETGLRTVFHHHCAGFIETPAETDRLMEMTADAGLGLCLDTGHWLMGGGGKAVDVYRRYADRIWHVHFKEFHAAIASRMRTMRWDYFDALANRVFYRLGTGDVRFAAILEELRNHGYDGWIVVEDEMPPGKDTPLESARADREFLRGLGL